ncbi:siroheme decarboxylase subunit beta [Denitromonas iodatirespirans]|uniref:siroheme decarboxylase n=1 Tax=Denitromonas iodatirespirans TaxID=2795389 RepID=A0A944D953_DENI1|nr:Lrp/AsnC family transcriptional regulator [Denitromonas iodatirespirans]MBT0962249.1 Lrp/AsnC family transcriptional regulator [Denitromonas iodatirespirans]
MDGIDSRDRALIVATQGGLPLVSQPYHLLGEMLDMPPAEVQARLARLLDCGVIRRIGAVPNHYALGYVANGMTVWDVDDDRIDALGEAVGQMPCVTHCYQRPRHLPDWPYNLFAMVHGHDRDEVLAQAAHIAEVLGDAVRARDVLFSSKILKKTGLRLVG